MNDRIVVEIERGVADVRLARALKRNALDEQMFAALVETGARLAREPGLRAVVLSGEGSVFCAGIDIDTLERLRGGAPRALMRRTHGFTNIYQQAVWTWHELPVPVIAAVHGVAFGGGFQLTLGADIRVAAPDARFSVMEICWGLVPDMGGTQLMHKLARDDVIRDLTYTGRIFSSDEALAYGLVTRVCRDPHLQASAIAREIAGHSPDAVRAAKRLLNEATAHLPPGAGLLSESRAQERLIGSENHREAVRARIEHRPPHFKD